MGLAEAERKPVLKNARKRHWKDLDMGQPVFEEVCRYSAVCHTTIWFHGATTLTGGIMPFWKCYYHAVWGTGGREPIITDPIEKLIFETIKRKSEALSCPVLAINGTADHIHIAVSIIPSVSVAEWVRNVKGLSTHEVNTHYPDLATAFRWQKSYGILTYGEKHLSYVVNYVENQKDHHAHQTLQPYLEHTGEE